MNTSLTGGDRGVSQILLDLSQRATKNRSAVFDIIANNTDRKGGHIFDISLHGFPYGMIKSCRRYWTNEIADSIVQLKDIRFVNPQMDVWTTFTREDYTRVLVEKFGLERAHVEKFYDHLRAMNFYDNNPETTGQMFARYFPGRDDVQRLLMEPIAYANGSTLDDPAITFGIVFSNFMSKGVFIFQGGTDTMINLMTAEMKANGVDIRRIVASVNGMSVNVLWDATTDVSAFILSPGMYTFDFDSTTILRNNAGTGKNGDILFTTIGASAGDTYSITLEMIKIYAA